MYQDKVQNVFKVNIQNPASVNTRQDVHADSLKPVDLYKDNIIYKLEKHRENLEI